MSDDKETESVYDESYGDDREIRSSALFGIWEGEEEAETVWNVNGQVIFQHSFTMQIQDAEAFEALIYGTYGTIPIFIPDPNYGRTLSRLLELQSGIRSWSRKFRRGSCQE